MSLAHFVTLGRSGLKVSPLCLGAMTFGEEFKMGSNAEVSQQILERYVELGGNFVDTANIYNRGSSEQILGDWLTKRPDQRRQMVIATKFSANMFPGNPNAGGASRLSIVRACEDSLRRLRTDYIDLYWQHWMDFYTPIEETMRALEDLVASGKVRYVGFSDTPAWRVAQAQMLALTRGWAPLIALQIEYSLLERTVEGELMPMAQEFGLGVTPWSPLRSGFLTGKYTRASHGPESPGRAFMVSRNLNEKAFTVVDAVIAVAKQIGTTPARVALAWVRSRPGVASPIIGARTPEQLEDNLACLEVQLGAEQLATLDAASTPTHSFPYHMVRDATNQSYGGLTINGNAHNPHGWAKPADKK